MTKLIIAGLGGFAGSMMRYAVSGWVQHSLRNPWTVIGTLTVNIIGCFFIGLLAALVESRQLFSPEMRILVLIGFLGGFTTFSTFSYETIQLIHEGQFLSASLNVFYHVFLGLGAVYLGQVTAKLM